MTIGTGAAIRTDGGHGIQIAKLLDSDCHQRQPGMPVYFASEKQRSPCHSRVAAAIGEGGMRPDDGAAGIIVGRLQQVRAADSSYFSGVSLAMMRSPFSLNRK